MTDTLPTATPTETPDAPIEDLNAEDVATELFGPEPPTPPVDTPPLTEEERKQKNREKRRRQKEKAKAGEKGSGPSFEMPAGYQRLLNDEELEMLKGMKPHQKRLYIKRKKEEMTLEALVRGKLDPDTPSDEVEALKAAYRSMRGSIPDKVHGNVTKLQRQAKKIIRDNVPHAMASVDQKHAPAMQRVVDRINGSADNEKAAEAARPGEEDAYA